MQRVKTNRDESGETGESRAPAGSKRRSPCFGTHLSIAGGFHNAIEAAHALRCRTVQIFVKNQRQWRATPFDPADLERWHALYDPAAFGPVVAHATYLINMASPDGALAARSVAAFTEELERCQTLNVPYLVIHPGAATDGEVEAAIARVAEALNGIFAAQPELRTMPLLETTAGQGTTLGRTFEELGAIIRRLNEPQRVGVCVDTCHAFAAGYDLRTAEGYAEMIAAAEREVGLARIRCWHLNDSVGACGSHLDRHAHIGAGQLGTAGFAHLLADARFDGVPMVLETPKGTDERGRDYDRVNLQRLRALATRARRGS